MEAAGREPRPQPGAPGAGTPAALLLALQRTAGNGAVSRAIGLQRTLTNDATWGPVEPTTGQGTSVRAVSGPGYTYGSGPKSPAPGFRPYLYTAMFSAATTGAYYCQGHLLNDNLGGPGDPAAAHAAQNLTAFPQRPTNTDHKSAIENPIKSAALGAWYLYEVTIGYSTDSAPRLRRRLGVNAAMAPAAGIAATDTTFTYASSLSAQWTELVQGLASTNAAPPVKPAGDAGTLSLSIPSPMTFTTNEAGEYPNYVKTGSYQHMPKLKGNQAANRIGTLPGGGSATLAGRAYVLPMRWEAVDFARAGNPAPPPGKNATYQAGFQHYGDGVTGSRTGVTVTRYGLGFTLGYADFEAGLVHGRAHAQASPPAPPPAATVDGHNEFWAGVVLGRTSLLAAPPVGNRAHIAGHHEFWAGVLHARSNPELPAPVNLAEATGHNEYWAGVNLALTTLKATKPAGNLASEEGHQAYWEGAEAARADPAAPVVPSTTAKVMGHTDFINGVTHARANPRVTAPAMGSLARSASWTEYWQGVDFARANPAATPCAGPSSAEKAGAADYREGADAASKDLGSFAGAPPVGGGAREGFEDLTSGAKGHQAGTPADAARTAHVRGWQDSAAGMAAGGAVAPAPPVRTDGGFMSGFLHAHGGALAQGAQPAPAGGLEQSVAGGGHAAYGTGLAAARADLASVAPVPLVQAQAHGEFVAGVVHARASGRGAAPAAGSLARTQAWTEYWQGVDFARANSAATAYTGASSAERAGVLDYRAGTDLAARDLASLTGAPPVGGGAHEGFGDYQSGVDSQQGGIAADPGRSGQVRAWHDSAAGMTAGWAPAPQPPAGTEGGYLSGFLHAHGGALAQGAQPAPAGGLEQSVAAGGHTAYGTGLAAARHDLEAPGPAPLVEAQAHSEFLSGVAQARTAARGTAPVAGSVARTQAWTEYWQGVDFARANPAVTPYSGPSSAERSGVADYRAGSDQAHASLASLAGAAPAAGGSAEGFGDFKDGVDGCQGGIAADVSRSAQLRGWQDCAAGMAVGGVVSPAAPVRTDGGFMSGFLYAHGAALAQGAQPAPVGGLDHTIAAGGHAGYLAGLATARAGLGSPTPQRGADALGHGDFVAGVAHARASVRGVAPGAGSLARTQAWTEYWQGVDWARANPVTAAYAGLSSAEEAGAADCRIGVQHAVAQPSGTALPSAEPAAAEGAADYWQGEAHAAGNAAAPGGPALAATTAYTDYWNGAGHAQGSLVNLQGAPPAGRVQALGFAAYQGGAYGADHSLPDVPANLAYSYAWNAYTDAAVDVRAGAVNGLRLDSGYLYGVLHTNAPVAKRRNGGPGSDAKRTKHF